MKMTLKNWYEKEIIGKQMCVECKEIIPRNKIRCPRCLCSIFIFMSTIIHSPLFENEIKNTEKFLNSDPRKCKFYGKYDPRN